jgi:hypothetical protein
MKQNYERVAHKIEENEKEGKTPGYAHLYDLIRAQARFDHKDEMIAAIRGVV